VPVQSLVLCNEAFTFQLTTNILKEGCSVKSLKTVLGVKECSECENYYRSFCLKLPVEGNGCFGVWPKHNP